jgi:drug/metabolite transporter (DMT)-like permease
MTVIVVKVQLAPTIQPDFLAHNKDFRTGNVTNSLKRFIDSRPRLIGLGATALAASLWGVGGVFAVLTTVSGLELTLYRLWMGVVLLGVVSWSSGRRINRSSFRSTWFGGLLLAADMAMYFSSVKLTSIVDVSVIGAFQPALVLICARRFFHERMEHRDVLWIVLAMVGVIGTVLGPGVTTHRQLSGDLLAVGSLLCWTAYWLVSKRTRESMDTIRYTFGATLWAAIFITPVAIMFAGSLGNLHASDWFWIVLITVIPGGGDLAMNWAHHYVDASVSSAITCVSPVVAAVAALLILGQPLTLVQCLGGLIGLTAITFVAAHHRQPLVSPLE